MFQDNGNKESQIQTDLNFGLMKDRKDSLYESVRETEGCQNLQPLEYRGGLRGIFAKRLNRRARSKSPINRNSSDNSVSIAEFS